MVTALGTDGTASTLISVAGVRNRVSTLETRADSVDSTLTTSATAAQGVAGKLEAAVNEECGVDGFFLKFKKSLAYHCPH